MFWIVLAITAFLNNAQAQEARSRFSADDYTRKSSEDKVILQGNVNILRNNTFLKADKVELNTKTENFFATGNVNYDSDSIKISGESIDGNMDSPKGFISNGKIINGPDIFEGKKIERLDKKHFLLKEGRYTSCVNSPPDWRLYGNDIDLRSGEYANLEDVVIEAFGIPMVYIPYLVLPVKTERQSGFLAPKFGFGTDGFNIHESYFWAITRSQDMTFTLGHYNNRGFKQAVEFRSAYAQESNTTMYYFHVNDKKFANLIVDNTPLGKKNRNGVTMTNEFKLTEDSYAKLNVLYASDQNIPRDFADEMPGRAEPALESKLLLTTHSNNVSYNADLSYYQNMLSKNPLDNNNDQLQRLPELSLSLAKTKFSKFMFESDASYLNIYRTGSTYDDNNGNKVFDDGDFVRTGQRFDLYPRLSMPLSNRYIKFTPQIGGRYDYYVLPDNSNAKRGYVEAKAKLSSEISSIYSRNNDKRYRALKHVIEPFIEYSVIPHVSQSANPFFDAKNGGLTAPGFDSIDQIGKTNTVTYGISNRLLTKYITNFVEPIVIKDAQEREEYNEEELISSCTDCNETPTEEKEPTDREKISIERTGDFLGLRESESEDTNNETSFSEPQEDEFTILQPVQWNIYQSYNFLDTTGKPFGYIYSDILANYEWANLLLSNFYNVYTKRMGVSSRLRLVGSKKYIEIGYYNNQTDPSVSINQARLMFGFELWRFGTNVSFIFNNLLPGSFSKKLQDKVFDVTYQPPSSCWFLKLAANAPYDRPGVDISFTFNLIISGQKIGFGAGQGLFGKSTY